MFFYKRTALNQEQEALMGDRPLGAGPECISPRFMVLARNCNLACIGCDAVATAAGPFSWSEPSIRKGWKSNENP